MGSLQAGRHACPAAAINDRDDDLGRDAGDDEARRFGRADVSDGNHRNGTQCQSGRIRPEAREGKSIARERAIASEFASPILATEESGIESMLERDFRYNKLYLEKKEILPGLACWSCSKIAEKLNYFLLAII